MPTGWILDEMPLAKIIDHPVNHAVYGDNFDDALVESIKQNGVLEPLIVVKHGGGSFICLSGHRRKQAAKIAGLDKVPVRMYRGEMAEWEQRIVLGEANRSRTKTTEQQARETKMLAEAYSERAKARMKSGKSNPTQNSGEGRHSNESLSEAAKASGIGSRDTAAKAIEVVEEIDKATEAGDTEKAEDLRETLNKKSVRAAHQKATGKKAAKKAAKKTAAVSEREAPCQSLAANIEWCLRTVVPKVQEYAIIAERILGKKAGLFDVEAVKTACKSIFTEFGRIEREAKVRAEAEKRCNSEA